MSSIFGIIHPQLFHSKDFLEKMLKGFDHVSLENTLSLKKDYYELAITGGELYTHEKTQNTLFYIGRVYNISSLQADLKKSGYQTEGFSPSKTLYSLYEQKGEDFIHDLNGDFCLCLILRNKKACVLYTDRMAKFKLYWAYQKDYLVFSTHLKALLRTGLIPQELSKTGISSYLSLGFFPQDLSPVKDLQKLLPGHALYWEHGRGVEVKSYWSLSEQYLASPAQAMDERLIVETLEQKLQKAIDLRLSSSPPAIFVGGGLGSATLSALMSCQSPTLFSLEVEGNKNANDRAVDYLANTLGLPHQSLYFSPLKTMQQLLSLMWTLDEPLADSHTLYTWELCKQCSKSHSDFFSGMGAKELLGLHNRYQCLAPCKKKKKSPWENPFLSSIIHFFSRFSMRFSFQTLQYFHQKLNPQNAIFEENLFHNHERKRLSPLTTPYFSPSVFIKTFSHLKDFPSQVHAFLYYDTKTQLCDRFLSQYQCISQHYKLSWHTPYLDHELMAFMTSIPILYKSQSSQFPTPLKGLLEKFSLGKDFTQRPRSQGRNLLNAPIEDPFLKKITQALYQGVLVESGILNAYYLNKYLFPITPLSFNRFFSILSLEVWTRLFILNNLEAAPPNEHLLDFLYE